MARTPEGVVKDAVKAWLKVGGIWYYMPVQNGMGVVGIPDFICCEPYEVKPEDVGKVLGLFRAIETKAPGKLKTVTANQERVLGQIKEHHGIVDVVDSVTALKRAEEA